MALTSVSAELAAIRYEIYTVGASHLVNEVISGQLDSIQDCDAAAAAVGMVMMVIIAQRVMIRHAWLVSCDNPDGG